MRSIPVVLILALVLFVIVISERWKWRECRQVGHGFWYCLSEQSK